MDVVGAAADGGAALAAASAGSIDALVLDLEMPGLDGLETLRRLAAADPNLVVVLFTGHPEGVSADRAGRIYGRPVHVLRKTSRGGNEVQTIGKELIPWLRDAQHRSATSPPAPVAALAPARVPLVGATAPDGRRRAASEVRLVVIGSSTGGPNAVAEVLKGLTPDFPAPICITQHMPEGFTAAFAERLDRGCGLSVHEAAGGDVVVPGTVWVAPGGRHLEVAFDGPRLVTRLTDGPLENSCRPAVDPLFRSAASALGDSVLGLVLTGMGKDGLEGARALRGVGASVFVQDEATSVVWGMPGAVAQAGLADEIRSLDEISTLLMRTVNGRARRRRTG